MQNGSIILIFGDEMNVKGNACRVYRKLNYCVFTMNRLILYDDSNFSTAEIFFKILFKRNIF